MYRAGLSGLAEEWMAFAGAQTRQGHRRARPPPLQPGPTQRCAWKYPGAVQVVPVELSPTALFRESLSQVQEFRLVETWRQATETTCLVLGQGFTRVILRPLKRLGLLPLVP